jgi:uncharacterized protein YidB (DUF937 family)
MGLLDSLIDAATSGPQTANTNTNTNARSGAAGGAFGGLDPQMLIGIVGALINNAGGLSGLLAKLQQGGLTDAVQSWVGTGANQPVSPDVLGGALGPDLLGQLAQQMGGNQQQAAGTLADLLPILIDQLTPKGQLPADNGLGGLGGLGALLGGGASGGGADLMGALGGLLRR